jgi:hypothetical protein
MAASCDIILGKSRARGACMSLVPLFNLKFL